MKLYYGTNESHEFWEDESGNYLIIRHHRHDLWFALNVAGRGVNRGFGMAKRPQTIVNHINRHEGTGLELSTFKQWIRKRKNERKMKLVEV